MYGVFVVTNDVYLGVFVSNLPSVNAVYRYWGIDSNIVVWGG
jgi:hypothetical protein